MKSDKKHETKKDIAKEKKMTPAEQAAFDKMEAMMKMKMKGGGKKK